MLCDLIIFFIDNGKLFHSFPPEYIKLHLNKSNLGRGTTRQTDRQTDKERETDRQTDSASGSEGCLPVGLSARPETQDINRIETRE